MADTELDKTIEELEAEVLAELEEDASAPKKGAVPAQKDDKAASMKDADDGGDAVVEPDAKDSPTDVAADNADEVSGQPQQKGEKPAEKMKKVKEDADAEEEDDDDEEDAEDEEEVSESSSLKTKADHLAHFSKMKASEVKEMLKAYNSSLNEEDDEEEEDDSDDDEEEEAMKQDESVEKAIKEIDVAEDVDALMNGEDNLSEDFKTKAATIFEAAVKSKVRVEAHRIYEEIQKSKKGEMETFKEELTTQVDTYLNYVVEEWQKENELAIERGLKGEIAEDFIAGLKQLFEDHYIDVPNEKYDILEAQSEKIAELEGKLNEEIQKNVEIKESNSQMTREAVLTESSKDLADTEVEKFKELTADVDFTDEDSFREKIDTLKESYFPKTNPTSSDEGEETGLAQDVEVSDSMATYLAAISRSK